MDPLGWEATLNNYLRAFGWSLVAAISFSVGIAFAIKIFDLFSVNIDEWEELKKGNMAVSLVITSLIVMVGLIVYKVL